MRNAAGKKNTPRAALKETGKGTGKNARAFRTTRKHNSSFSGCLYLPFDEARPSFRGERPANFRAFSTPPAWFPHSFAPPTRSREGGRGGPCLALYGRNEREKRRRDAGHERRRGGKRCFFQIQVKARHASRAFLLYYCLSPKDRAGARKRKKFQGPT